MNMKSIKIQENELKIKSETEKLRKVILAVPKYFTIKEPINVTMKKYYLKNPPVIDIAIEQHKQFSDILKSEGVRIDFADVSPKNPYQVFTRDIGFIIWNKLFKTNFKFGIRKDEWCISHQKTININQGIIEGGDVLVDGNNIFVGITERTNIEGYHFLNEILPDLNLWPLITRKGFVHLDVCFNLLGYKRALIYERAFYKNQLSLLKDKYELISISKRDQEFMGTNVLSISPNKIVTSESTPNIVKSLESYGYDVITIPFTEILKGGGSTRCVSFPIARG